jgi:glycosyltransferase involved in cell wall biosynthesis
MKKILREFKVESHIEVVPNGADLGPFLTAKPIPRAEFGFSKNDTILVYAGRIAPEKNMEFLLKAFAGVAHAVPKVHLLVVGGGQKEHEDDLKRVAGELRIEDRIRFTGMVSKDTLPSYLALGDIFVTASVTEVHPFSVISHGSWTPVVGLTHQPAINIDGVLVCFL